MIYLVLFLIELFSLFLLSRFVTRNVSALLYRITKNEKATIHLLSFLFLPGVVVHELSHLIVAAALFVPVGEIEFVPKITGEQVKMGSVAIGHTDPLRRLLIGVAPVLVGCSLLLSVVWYFSVNHPFAPFVNILLVCLLVFEIGNTMFSSKKDMEGALGVLLIILLLGVLLYVFGVRIPIEVFLSSSKAQQFFQLGTRYLLLPLGVDCLLLVLMQSRKVR